MDYLEIPTFLRRGGRIVSKSRQINTYANFARCKKALLINDRLNTFAGQLANDRIVQTIARLDPETRAKWEERFDANRS